MDFPKTIAIFSILLGWAPLVVYFRKTPVFEKAVHILAVIMLISASSDSIGFFFSELKVHTIVLYNIQDVLQFALFSWFYYEIAFKDNGKQSTAAKLILIPGTLCYLLSFTIVSIYFQNPFSSYQNILWTTSAAILIVYACLYCNKLFIEISTASHVQFNVFVWINSGILYYFSFSIFLFLTQSLLVSEFTPDITRLIWSFNNINAIIKNVLIMTGLVLYSQRLSVK